MFAMRFVLLFVIGVFGQLAALAHIELPSILGSNMVLPQAAKARLWGWASPSEKIAVTTSWDNRTDSVVTDRNGKWQLWVQTPKAGGPYQIGFLGGNKITLDNVLIGAVWLCSGQSNMEWNYHNGVEGMQREIDKGVQPELRFFQIARKTALYPQEDVKGAWVVCDSNTLKSFSAVGYFFGQRLHDSLKMPIGLINASWGGTPAEVWMPSELVLANETWKKEMEKQNKTPWWTITPGAAYNAMIAPLTPFTIDGAIWYQGESNVGAAKSYGGLFTTLIQAWRGQWERELPFYFVQIAPYTYGNHFGAAQLREEQARVAATLPHTGMVVASDLVNDTTNIHPTNKRDVGHRLAALALQDAYGKNIKDYRSLAYAGMEKSGGKLRLSFKGTDAKLLMKGKEPRALLIAGADSVFVPAKARVAGNVLEVWHPKIKEPVAVRYGFSSAGVGNLSDSYGLPVAPFRTDEWPL